MKTVNTEELLKKVNEIGGCDAKEAYAAGWDKAIEEVISIIEDMNSNAKRSYKVGDKINVNLKGFGEFTATAQKIMGNKIIFIFDDCVARMPMNRTATNAGGYDASGLCYWVNTALRAAFPDELRESLIDISIPTYGQMFGHDETYERYFEPDNDEQFELMKIRKNRIADYENEWEWYWLQNATKENVSASTFAYVYYGGSALCDNASASLGVRPVFTLSV